MDIDFLATCWSTSGTALPLEGQKQSPLPLADRIEAAARAGFTGFGVAHYDLARYLEDHSFADLKSLLATNNIKYFELEFLEDWWQPEGSDERAKSDETLQFMLEVADIMRPHDVKISPDATSLDYDHETWVAGWRRLCDAFAETDTNIALEFMPFSNIPTIAAGRKMIEAAGRENGGLLLDLWHIMRGDPRQLDDLAALPLELVKAVELNDADAEPVGDLATDTINNRHYPGDGVWPVEQYIKTLLGMGWRGPWGIEVLSVAHRSQPLDRSLPELVNKTRVLFP